LETAFSVSRRELARSGVGMPMEGPCHHGHCHGRSYAITYAFSDERRDEYETAVAHSDRTVAKLQREGITLACLGTTEVAEVRGERPGMMVRYISSGKAPMGQLNCRTGLPASGAPQRIAEACVDGLPADSKPATNRTRRSRRPRSPRRLEAPL
jgi:hypothetical protein